MGEQTRPQVLTYSCQARVFYALALRGQAWMADKYCDHNSTHGCTNLVPANQRLCDNCAKGHCS